ncbi:MAG: hypothetical protein AAF518_21985 [Spirochaetota bacterium]
MRTFDGGTTWDGFDTGRILLSTSSSSGSLAGGFDCPDTSTCYIAPAINQQIAKITNASATTPSIGDVGSTGFFYDIHCTSNTFCYAVGISGIRRTTDGTNWTSLTSPAASAESESEVFCTDTNTCYVATSFHTSMYKTTNASATTPSWSTQTLPDSGVSDLHCSSATDCMAVGTGNIVKTSDGTNWTSVTKPSVSGTSTIFNGVYCFDANTCTIVGNSTTIWRTSDGGSNWTNQSIGSTNNNYDLSCTSSSSNTCYISASVGIVFKRSSN